MYCFGFVYGECRLQQRFLSSPVRGAAGFTLVELILVLVLVGIIAALSADLITKPFQAFTDQKNRAELTAEADMSLTRIVRELRMSLPNSVRVSADGKHIEFIPAIAGGRYRAVADEPGQSAACFGDEVATTGCGGFDVLGDLIKRSDQAVASGDRVVIFNASASDCSSPAANAYCDVDENNWAVINAVDNDLVDLSAEHRFPFRSGSAQRFYIVPQTGPVSFYCDGNKLYRADDYGFEENQPISGFGAPRLLGENVKDCHFTYSPGTHTRSAVVSAKLTLEKNNETVSLIYQTQVLNTP